MSAYLYVTTKVLVLSICTSIILSCSAMTENEKSMQKLVPKKFSGWKVTGKIEIYDRKTIFDYIDGAGEVYLSYSFREVMVFRLTQASQPTIQAELFDMGSSEDAFGVFSHAREGEEQGIGQGSEYRGGVLCFWKANFFVCVFPEQETPETRKVIFDLAQAISENIPATGTKPKLIDYLPAFGLQEKSVRYFHLHTSLNYHYFVASQNILKLGWQTEAVLGTYQPEKSLLLCIRYQSEKEAKEALDSFISAYIPEAKESDIVQIENGKWVGAKLEGTFVVVVFDAPTQTYAQSLIEAIKEKLSY